MKYLSILFLMLVSISSYADSGQDEITQPILKAIDTGKTDRVFSLAYPKGSPQRKYFSDSDVAEYDAKFRSLLESMGKSHGYFEYTKSDIPGIYEMVHYVFKFDRQPALVVFQLYKPENEWHLHSLAIDPELDDHMESSSKYRIGALGHEDVRLEIQANKGSNNDK